MDISIDHGQTWITAQLDPAPNKYAWKRWHASVELPQACYFEVWVGANDDDGNMRPANPPDWKPKEYLNNMQRRNVLFAL